ncbi:hypothetical protein C0Q99_14510 [Streptomyces albidoflavus]|nr:hypothetical protein C0Q99_14510 [Streptomyces albidoflavus]
MVRQGPRLHEWAAREGVDYPMGQSGNARVSTAGGGLRLRSMDGTRRLTERPWLSPGMLR